MKHFNEWRIEEAGYLYSQSIDGPPLEPTSISGAENQIRTLARNIRTSFNFDPRWKKFQDQILSATKHLDDGANMLGKNMSREERNQPHQ
jgi:hypothetical protein